jgi:hypothetical protein
MLSHNLPLSPALERRHNRNARKIPQYHRGREIRRLSNGLGVAIGQGNAVAMLLF